MQKKQHLFNNIPILIFFLVLIFIIMAHADNKADSTGKSNWQRSLNLDFEKSTPADWIIGGEGYQVVLDKTEKKHGLQSLGFSAPKGINPGIVAFAALKMPLRPFQGKRIRFSGYLKTGKKVGDLYLWIRADQGLDPLAFKRIQRGKGPKKDSNWQKYVLEMDVSNEAGSLFLGASMRGEGKGWLDEITVEILHAKGPEFLTISGKVLDKEGNMIPNALVTVKTVYQESALKIKKSSKKGEFSFKLLPGFYTINGCAPGQTGGTIPEQRYNHNSTNLKLKLGADGFFIQGKVKTTNGKIPNDLYVAALQMEYFGWHIFYTRPADNGDFQIKVPKGSKYMVLVDSKDYEAVPRLVQSGFKGSCTLKAQHPKTSPAEVTNWLKNNILPLRTAEPGKDFSDLQPLKKIIGQAKVVGLGETSHGNREIFQMKHRIFEFLVKEMGFTVFAFEAPWPRAKTINDYVLYGKVDAEQILAAGHFIWDTKEVLALIQWIRKYNLDPKNNKKIKFYCLDVRHPELATSQIFNYLQKVDPEYSLFFKKQLSGFGAGLTGYIYRSTNEQCQLLQNQIKDLIHYFDKNKEVFSKISGNRKWLEMRQVARSLQQTVIHAITSRTSDYQALDQRDRFMVENAMWILKNEGPGTKMAYWAHNFHITYGQYPALPCKPMGYYMKQKLGNKYISIGFEFNQGSLQSRDSTHSRTLFMVRSFSFKPITGSYASAFSKTGFPIFLIDLRQIPGRGIVHDWFFSPHVFKSIDSLFASKKDIQHLFVLPDYFDVLIFFEHTSRARPNPSRYLPGQIKGTVF